MKQRNDLSTYKRDINLATFAALLGYEIDRKKSTKTSIAMKYGNDKIIITKKGNVWVYFSVFDNQDSGTIVDFVINRMNKSINEVGPYLADWSGLGAVPFPAYQIEQSNSDPDRVKAIFDRCQPVSSHQYLGSRGLGDELLTSDRFYGRVYTDRYDNAVFPHYQKGQVCGLELKNNERGMLVKGSQKTFWRSNSKSTDRVIVITEAVIDALSYQQLFKHKNAMYLATGGGVSDNQLKLLTKALESTSNIKSVVVATDNDAGGDRIAKRLLTAIRECSFAGKVMRHRPLREGEDWNDVLQNG